MPSIYEISRGVMNFTKYDGRFGLEIETETKSPYDIPRMKFFNVVPDNSLRNFGQEYVLKQPLNYGEQMDDALEEFTEKTSKLKFIKDALATSVHVHINMLNETFNTLANFLTVYGLFENLLIRYSGPDRLSNLFCLPICDAEQNIQFMQQAIDAVDSRNRFIGWQFDLNQTKYASLNLASLNNRGSLEVRCFRGETDPREITKWLTILNDMVEYCRGEVTPNLVLTRYKEKGLRYVQDVFPNSHRFLLANLPNAQELIDANLWYASKIATSRKDWKSYAVFKQFREKTVPKEQYLNLLEESSALHFGSNFKRLTAVQKIFIQEEVERQLHGVAPAVNEGVNPGVLDNPFVPRERVVAGWRQGIIGNLAPAEPQPVLDDDLDNDFEHDEDEDEED